MFSHLLQSLRSTGDLVIGLWNDPSGNAGTDPAALADLHHRITVHVDRLRAWNPEGGHLRALKDSGEQAEQRIPTVRAVNQEWANFIKVLDREVTFYQALWERLPGLSQRRLHDFDWTLTQPLEKPYDLLVQDYLSQASAEFRKAWHSFQHGNSQQAVEHHRRAMTDCDLAEAAIRCCQYGHPQQKEKLQELYLASGSPDAMRELYAYLREAPWDQSAARSAAQSAARSTTQGTTQGASSPANLMARPAIPAPPTAAPAATPSASSSTPTAASPVSTQPVTIRADAPLLDRLTALDVLLQGRGSSPGREMQAFRQPDGALRLGLMRLERADIRNTALDPDGQLSLRLVMLEGLATSQQPSPSPSFLSTLRGLEQSVERAQSAQQRLREARDAAIRLKKLVDADPTTKRVLIGMVGQVEKLQKAAADAGQAGQADLKLERAGECLALATKMGEKARQMQEGLWPDAEEQLQRWASLQHELSKVEDGPLQMIRDRLRQRFKAQEWAFHTADDSQQAQAMLEAMSGTLNTIQSVEHKEA